MCWPRQEFLLAFLLLEFLIRRCISSTPQLPATSTLAKRSMLKASQWKPAKVMNCQQKPNLAKSQMKDSICASVMPAPHMENEFREFLLTGPEAWFDGSICSLEIQERMVLPYILRVRLSQLKDGLRLYANIWWGTAARTSSARAFAELSDPTDPTGCCSCRLCALNH